MIRTVNLCLLAKKVMHFYFQISFIKCSTKMTLKNVSILSMDQWISGSVDQWISGSVFLWWMREGGKMSNVSTKILKDFSLKDPSYFQGRPE